MRHVNPFARNLAILAVVAVLVVVLNQETALYTAGRLLQLAFVIAIAVVVYFLWRDFGRREIGMWPQRAQVVFYAAGALLVADVGWWMTSTLNGRDALAFFAVAAASAYALVRTWRSQTRLL
jgi:hypothetical protein